MRKGVTPILYKATAFVETMAEQDLRQWTAGLEYLWQRNQDVVHLWAALNQWRFQPLADEVIAYPHEHGFGLQGIYRMAYDPKGGAIQGDFLFAKK